MLAPWVWSLVTICFLLGVKIYRPVKSDLPVILMGWSSTLLLVSSVLFIDGIVTKANHFTWEPLVLSMGVFIFCFCLYRRNKSSERGKQKQTAKGSKAKAC